MQNKPNLILTFATMHKPTDNSSLLVMRQRLH